MRGRRSLSLLLGAASFIAVPVSASAQESSGTFDFYGQLSPSILNFDDGRDTYTNGVDNANSNSRAGITYDVETGIGSLRFRAEAALGFAQSSDFSQTFVPEIWDWQVTDIRKIEVSLKNDFGTFWAGQGSMATDGAAEVDLSGTSVIGYSEYYDVAGGYDFALRGGGLSSVAIDDVFVNLDGGRRLRVRYDTPTWNGLSFATALGQDVLSGSDTQYYDLALRYGIKPGDVRLDAAVGYSWSRPPGDDATGQLMASLSALHEPTGLNLTLAAGQKESSGSYGYAKLGWIGRFIPAGTTSFAVEYYASTGFAADDGAASSAGVMAVQSIEKYSVDLYAGYRVYDYDDDTATDYADASSLMAGARWKF